MRKATLLTLMFVSFVFGKATAQDDSSVTPKPVNISTRNFLHIDKNAKKVENKLAHHSLKALAKLERQELRLKAKLAKNDSLSANRIFGDVKAKYEGMRASLSRDAQKIDGVKQYIPGLDSLATSLKFISANSTSFLVNDKGLGELNDALKTVNGIGGQLQSAESIRQYLKDRTNYLKAQLGQFGLVKDLQKFQKQVYYYTEQVKNYKELLNDPDKLERKTLEIIAKLPAFKQFFNKHSELASLFMIPGDLSSSPNIVDLPGLQTRSQINDLIQGQIVGGGQNAMSQIQQNISDAQNELKKIQDKLTQSGSNDGDMDLPDFKPNSEKTHTFWNRLEYGTNIQSTKSTQFVPVSTDLGLSVGYKLSQSSIIGIGMSYKFGWGKDIQHITITHEGIGLRSFVDHKLKGTFYLSGGYEQNYRQQFDNIQLLKYIDNWQQSGLIGISKLITFKSKFFKNTKMQLMWDFLSYQQIPKTQPIIFRLGYNFK